MLAALAFIQIDDVPATFRTYKTQIPQEIEAVVIYFDETHITDEKAHGRRKAVAPRCPIELWNQYSAAIDGSAKTKNVSEGWHNRFRILVAKHHPDIYSACAELQKEQGATEISLVELSLGKKIRAAPKKKWLETQDRIKRITD